jgi:hypothetical protein
MQTPPAGRSLSKSRFLSGTQCLKKLWWEVHEPDAPELVPDAERQVIFDRGHRVGELARTYVPGGVLIDFPYHEVDNQVNATSEALRAGASVVYEASFKADGVFAAVDILERREDGFILSEVKSTLDVKEAHISDVAIQMHVLQKAGLPVVRGEVMHLNRECRFPDLSNLFARTDVTEQVQALLPNIPNKIRLQLAMLQGQLPEVVPGEHCSDPYPCPFATRCWPALPEHHVSTLYKISPKKVAELLEAGHETLQDLPDDFQGKGPALRQIASARSGQRVVASGLLNALRFQGPIAFLDFETIMPPFPAWPGCGPLQQVPVQFSCHILGVNGVTHHQWLAAGSDDPREPLARALLQACDGAATVLAYHAPAEKGAIEHLIRAVPHLANELKQLHDRIEDLLPIVRNHVYDPAFGGKFGLKKVLPALVPDLGYDNLEIQDGYTASAALEELLLRNTRSPEETQILRQHLLEYCARDTLGLVRLHQRLWEIAGA